MAYYNVSGEKKEEWKQKAVENQNKAKALIKKISDGFTNDPGQIAELLEFASRFYKYSIGNTELIKAQNPGATYVQSYNAWKKEGIHVNKNETDGLVCFDIHNEIYIGKVS